MWPGPSTPRPVEARQARAQNAVVSDADLITAICDVLAASPFHGEGYRKVRARLAHRGDAVGGKRVLRLMRLPPVGPAPPGAAQRQPGA